MAVFAADLMVVVVLQVVVLQSVLADEVEENDAELTWKYVSYIAHDDSGGSAHV